MVNFFKYLGEQDFATIKVWKRAIISSFLKRYVHYHSEITLKSEERAKNYDLFPVCLKKNFTLKFCITTNDFLDHKFDKNVLLFTK
jgi:hypothetical protein